MYNHKFDFFSDLFTEVMAIYHKWKNDKILLLASSEPEHIYVYNLCTGNFVI